MNVKGIVESETNHTSSSFPQSVDMLVPVSQKAGSLSDFSAVCA